MYPPFIQDVEWDELPQSRTLKQIDSELDDSELDDFDEEAEFGFILGNE